jgi:transcriptional regulator with XRE-family HTH domain
MDAFYKEFGSRLQRARKKAGLTQKQVAERVELARTSITNIERGSQHIALHQLYQLAAVVGQEPTALLPDQAVVLDDLLSQDALEVIAENPEWHDFAVRVLGKSAGVRGQHDDASASS